MREGWREGGREEGGRREGEEDRIIERIVIMEEEWVANYKKDTINCRIHPRTQSERSR